ncbi:hypothetical protein [Nonomuraea endophytica]|uniref:hypothetical protein n=1 Tax=Nonomuraea endophytica TaxID=714136 RepID=UPI0037C870D5
MVASKDKASPEPVAEAPQGRVFEWTGQAGQSITFVIPERMKRGKVARCLGRDDFVGALDVMFTAQEMAAFDELEFSPEEWGDLQVKLFEAIADVDPKT